MIAVIKTGGKQYVVKEGSTIIVEKLAEEKKYEFVSLLDGKKVTASFVGEEKGPKVRVFKQKPKKGYKKTLGHRQNFVKIKVEKIA